MLALILPIKKIAKSAMIININLKTDLENNDFMKIDKMLNPTKIESKDFRK
jgi:hypothetical protein